MIQKLIIMSKEIKKTMGNKANPSVDSANNKENIIEAYSDNDIQITISEINGYYLVYYAADIQLSYPEQLNQLLLMVNIAIPGNILLP